MTVVIMKNQVVLGIIFLFFVIPFNSCSKRQFSETLPLNVSEESYATKSDNHNIGKFEVDEAMAEYFAKVYRPDSKIISKEMYIEDQRPLFYVFNYEKGWSIVSSDRRTEPLLASSTDGAFSLKESENPGHEIMIQTFSAYLNNLKDFNVDVENTASLTMWRNTEYILYGMPHKKYDLPQTKGYWMEGQYYNEPYWMLEPVSYQIVDNVDFIYGPYIQTKWGQGYPWNLNVVMYNGHHCVHGCTAVAVGQMLNYCHSKLGEPNGLYHMVDFPTDFYYSGQSIVLRDFHANSSRWEDMPIDANDNNIQYASDLMLEVGHSVNMSYGLYASSAPFSPQHLSCFNLTCDTGAYNVQTVKNSLMSQMPLLIGGNCYPTPNCNTGNGEGHLWIINAYKQTSSRILYRYKWTLITPEESDTYDEVEIVDGDDYYLTYSEGIARNPTMEEFTEDYGSVSTRSDIRMNWGYDGDEDDVWYFLSSTAVWASNGSYFAGNSTESTLFYNFRIRN